MITLEVVEGPFDWVALPDDDADHEHDWRPVLATNASGRAYRCEICWDRTD
jgi:hypothetical protein